MRNHGSTADYLGQLRLRGLMTRRITLILEIRFASHNFHGQKSRRPKSIGRFLVSKPCKTGTFINF